MAVVYRDPTGMEIVLAKGAVERILERCVRFGSEAFTQAHEEDILLQMALLADQGFRVLALANRMYMRDFSRSSWSALEREEVEHDYNFLGLVAIYDPPRLETKDAIRACAVAGIQVHMLTGG